MGIFNLGKMSCLFVMVVARRNHLCLGPARARALIHRAKSRLPVRSVSGDEGALFPYFSIFYLFSRQIPPFLLPPALSLCQCTRASTTAPPATRPTSRWCWPRPGRPACTRVSRMIGTGPAGAVWRRAGKIRQRVKTYFFILIIVKEQ